LRAECLCSFSEGKSEAAIGTSAEYDRIMNFHVRTLLSGRKQFCQPVVGS
jgi:hypothetical protein